MQGITKWSPTYQSPLMNRAPGISFLARQTQKGLDLYPAFIEASTDWSVLTDSTEVISCFQCSWEAGVLGHSSWKQFLGR